jgi:phosphoglycolate phosphatase-like HAD superfamily hydrolase
MPNAGALALLAGLMEFLPTIGPAVSGTVGTFFAFFQGSTWMPVNQLTFAIVVGILYAIIGQIESIYLIPRLVGGRVRLHPAMAFVGIIAGTLVFGLLGVLLATPILASSRTILAYVFHKLLDREPFEPAGVGQSGVRIPGLIAGRKIDAVVFELDGVLSEVDWTAPAWARTHMTWLDWVIPPDTRAAIARRYMVTWEGLLNFLVNRFRNAYDGQGLDRRMPWINRLRGYPEPDTMQPQPGISRLLGDLATSYKLALVSTRPREEVDCFLQHAAIDPGLFSAVVTREEATNVLPHHDPLLLVIARLELTPAPALMVSDTDGNLRSARAMEMATAGVLCGLGQAKDFPDSDLVLQTTPELIEWL